MSTAFRYVAVPDGAGGYRHELAAANDAPPPGRRGRKPRVVPDPIAASAESAAQQLKQFIERVERIECEIADANDDKQDVLNEASSMGFDKKAIGKIVQRRKKEKHVLDEEDAIFETYKIALGMA